MSNRREVNRLRNALRPVVPPSGDDVWLYVGKAEEGQKGHLKLRDFERAREAMEG